MFTPAVLIYVIAMAGWITAIALGVFPDAPLVTPVPPIV